MRLVPFPFSHVLWCTCRHQHVMTCHTHPAPFIYSEEKRSIPSLRLADAVAIERPHRPAFRAGFRVAQKGPRHGALHALDAVLVKLILPASFHCQPAWAIGSPLQNRWRWQKPCLRPGWPVFQLPARPPYRLRQTVPFGSGCSEHHSASCLGLAGPRRRLMDLSRRLTKSPQAR